jgi:hypothetical protein
MFCWRSWDTVGRCTRKSPNRPGSPMSAHHGSRATRETHTGCPSHNTRSPRAHPHPRHTPHTSLVHAHTHTHTGAAGCHTFVVPAALPGWLWWRRGHAVGGPSPLLLRLALAGAGTLGALTRGCGRVLHPTLAHTTWPLLSKGAAHGRTLLERRRGRQGGCCPASATPRPTEARLRGRDWRSCQGAAGHSFPEKWCGPWGRCTHGLRAPCGSVWGQWPGRLSTGRGRGDVELELNPGCPWGRC